MVTFILLFMPKSNFIITIHMLQNTTYNIWPSNQYNIKSDTKFKQLNVT
jgi:hypothetical protein